MDLDPALSVLEAQIIEAKARRDKYLVVLQTECPHRAVLETDDINTRFRICCTCRLSEVGDPAEDEAQILIRGATPFLVLTTRPERTVTYTQEWLALHNAQAGIRLTEHYKQEMRAGRIKLADAFPNQNPDFR